MAPPVLFYVRHGLTDWNRDGRLQGRRDVPLNADGRDQAVHCAQILGTLFAHNGRSADQYDYVSSPLSRACVTMDVMRQTLGLSIAGYRIEPRLAEISFGEWEGLTYRDVLKRDPGVVARRENDKWLFRSPGGETYADVAERVGAWHATLANDTVISAHGGTARALIACLGIAPRDVAVHHPVDQGVVYVFEGDRVARHA
jgi:probable phosphoglycerate mutase